MTRITKAETRAIEKKFSETGFSLNQERNDFLLPQILDFVRDKKWINLRPEYQRRQVWDDKKRSRFIESLLLNVPIPPVFLYEWELSRYEVMDGQQRLNSIVDFYENGFSLKRLERWKELNGFHYRDLPEILQRGLDRRRLSATLLLLEGTGKVPPQHGDIRKLVFERLNTGGQHLNAQEIRNCLYAGPFNNLLIALSRDPLFRQIWEIPTGADLRKRNRRYQRMEDCEIVLRFFAFRKRANIRGSVRSMLDLCMKDKNYVNATKTELAGLKEDFQSRLKFARKLFGARVFQYEDNEGKWQLSRPLYDGIMVALDRLWPERTRLISARKRVVSNVSRLLTKPSAFEVIVGRPNTAKAVKKRMDLLVKAIDV